MGKENRQGHKVRLGPYFQIQARKDDVRSGVCRHCGVHSRNVLTAPRRRACRLLARTKSTTSRDGHVLSGRGRQGNLLRCDKCDGTQVPTDEILQTCEFGESDDHATREYRPNEGFHARALDCRRFWRISQGNRRSRGGGLRRSDGVTAVTHLVRVEIAR
jgi:hypothetical protein